MLFILLRFSHRTYKGIQVVLTFNPMHRMVPTSDTAKGDRIRSMMALLPVCFPGDKTEDPEKMSTETSWPFRTARPTSILSSDGCPIKTLDASDRGTKRTRPGMRCELLVSPPYDQTYV